MKAEPVTPKALFRKDVQYRVPMFQRPYVWNRKDQWQPLWDDVRRLAEADLRGDHVAPHFLGAVVVEHEGPEFETIEGWSIIDGQQRLTTLQLMLDATQIVVAQHGTPRDVKSLANAILNEEEYTSDDPDMKFKVWPTTRDQDAFRTAMDDATTVPPALVNAPIVEAHTFFADAARAWIEEDADRQPRATALTEAILNHLRLVAIQLDHDDNAQVIFESLNHRGSRLLASDLVKNLVFQRAKAERENLQRLYDRTWADLDEDYWRTDVRQGRLTRPRIDVFLGYWLVMKLRREVASDRVYAEFRDLAAGVPKIKPLVEELASDAKLFRSFESLPDTSVPGRFSYRVSQALDQAVFTPVFLWLMRADLPTDQRDAAIAALESWTVRRALLRLTTANYNRLTYEMLDALYEAHQGSAAHDLTEFLLNQPAPSGLWPDDASVRNELGTQQFYKLHTSARQRMVLEALEDDVRSTRFAEGASCPRGLSVEHVMPQSWLNNWPLDDTSSADERNLNVQRLGNLTLVTGKANSALSNRPWLAGGSGKIDYLADNSTLKLNSDLIKANPDTWTDDDIHDRTDHLIERLLSIWPRPDGGPSTIEALGTQTRTREESHAGTRTFVCLWDPATLPWAERSELRAALERGDEAVHPWSMGVRRSGVRPGDRIALFTMGEGPRGLVATGTARSAVYHLETRGEPGSSSALVDVGWDTIIEPDDCLHKETLEAATDGARWHFKTGGILLEDHLASAMEAAWYQHPALSTWQSLRLDLAKSKLNELVRTYEERLPLVAGGFQPRFEQGSSATNAHTLMTSPDAALTYALFHTYLALVGERERWYMSVLRSKNNERRTTIGIANSVALAVRMDPHTARIVGGTVCVRHCSQIAKAISVDYEVNSWSEDDGFVYPDSLDVLLTMLTDPWLSRVTREGGEWLLSGNTVRRLDWHNAEAAQWLMSDVGGSAHPAGETTDPGDWYVSFGDDHVRSWEDARTYGFVSAGGGEWYTRTLRTVPVGARVWVCIPGSGYVGTGIVTGAAQPAADATIQIDGVSGPLLDANLHASYVNDNEAAGEGDAREYVLPVAWDTTIAKSDAFWEQGMFANQNSACPLRDGRTRVKLSEHFGVSPGSPFSGHGDAP